MAFMWQPSSDLVARDADNVFERGGKWVGRERGRESQAP